MLMNQQKMNNNKLRRVLLAYSSRPPIMDYLESAFQALGIEVCKVHLDQNTAFDRIVIHYVNKYLHSLRLMPKSRNLFQQHPLSHRNFRSVALLEAAKAFQPDLTLLIRGISVRQDVLEAVRKIAPLMAWWVEKEERVGEAMKEIDLFDWYFFMNSSCVEHSAAQGSSHNSLLVHAVDPDRFYRMPEAEKKYDVCFVGNWSEKRQRFLEQVLQTTSNIAIYGGKWRKKSWNNPKLWRCIKGKYIDGDELVQLYNESRIVLNVTNWGFGEGMQRSGVNMRVLEVPATGAFLLTDDSRDLRSYFEPGKHLVVYTDVADCLKQIGYYLGQEQEREAIAAAGEELVRTSYTYRQIVKQILLAYEKL